MRIAALLTVFTLGALACAPEARAQQRSALRLDASVFTGTPLLLDPAGGAGSVARERLPVRQVQVPTADAGPRSWEWHVKRGVAIGAAAGLAWGLVERSRGNDVFGLSPVLQTAIGGGAGFYAGTAVYAVRRGPR